MDIKVDYLKKEEIKQTAEIACQGFSGLKELSKAERWITCNFNAFPRMQYFAAKPCTRTSSVRGRDNEKIVGYILWMEKGGFREKSVWELEQIAVKEDCRGQGIGTELIKKSLLEIKEYLKKRNSNLKLIEVTTGTENRAQKIYKDALGAEVECLIKDLFRGDEVIMIARYE